MCEVGWFLLVKCRPNFELNINKGFLLALCSNVSPDTPKKVSTLSEVDNMPKSAKRNRRVYP